MFKDLKKKMDIMNGEKEISQGKSRNSKIKEPNGNSETEIYSI